jgi:hypothetical protein
MTINFDSALDADTTNLLDACVVETDFACMARTHDQAVAKANKLWTAPIKDASGNLVADSDPDYADCRNARDAVAYQQSQVADIIRRLMWVKWPDASAAWFRRSSVSE